MEKKQIPDGELDVMLAVWRAESPSGVSVGEIYENWNNDGENRTKATLHTLLDRLCERGFLRFERESDSPTARKLYFPLVSEEEYRIEASKGFVQRICRGSWKNLVASLIDSNDISDEELRELAEMLRERNEK